MDGTVEKILAWIEHAPFQFILDGSFKEVITDFALGGYEDGAVIAKASLPLSLDTDAFFIIFPKCLNKAMQILRSFSEG